METDAKALVSYENSLPSANKRSSNNGNTGARNVMPCEHPPLRSATFFDPVSFPERSYAGSRYLPVAHQWPSNSTLRNRPNVPSFPYAGITHNGVQKSANSQHHAFKAYQSVRAGNINNGRKFSEVLQQQLADISQKQTKLNQI